MFAGRNSEVQRIVLALMGVSLHLGAQVLCVCVWLDRETEEERGGEER